MSSVPEPLVQLREQANELYWSSSETVDQIASRLAMSRKAVYASVQPTAAGASCMHCGGDLVFSNRTNRTSNLANCPACQLQVDLNAREEASADADPFGIGVRRAAPTTPAEMLAKATDGKVHSVPGPDAQSRWEQIKEDLSAVPAERAAKIGGAAALGVALGAAAVKAIKKRS
jgi:hypothetical protein